MAEKVGKRQISKWEIIGIIIAVYIVFLLIAALFIHTDKPRPVTCYSHQREIVACLLMYAQDHEAILPESSTVWEDIKIDTYSLICPQANKTPNGYLYNNNCSGLDIRKIQSPAKQLMTIDGKTTIGLNRAYNNILYSSSDVLFRHYEKEKNMYWAVASYGDGHVEIDNKINKMESWDKMGIISPSVIKVKGK